MTRMRITIDVDIPSRMPRKDFDKAVEDLAMSFTPRGAIVVYVATKEVTGKE